MTKSNQRRSFYTYEDQWDVIYKGCDLGDSVAIRAIQYPHVDAKPLIKWQEVSPEYDKAVEGLIKSVEQSCQILNYCGPNVQSERRRLMEALAAFEKAKGVK